MKKLIEVCLRDRLLRQSPQTLDEFASPSRILKTLAFRECCRKIESKQFKNFLGCHNQLSIHSMQKSGANRARSAQLPCKIKKREFLGTFPWSFHSNPRRSKIGCPLDDSNERCTFFILLPNNQDRCRQDRHLVVLHATCVFQKRRGVLST